MKVSYLSGSIWLLIICYTILSVYVVFEQATDGNSVSLPVQEQRHQRMLDGNSEFFNPWQYRIFSSLVVEAFHQTVHRLVPSLERVNSFLIFRVLQNLFIFILAELYFRAIPIQNPWLRLMGQLLLMYSMASSTFQSDLSFNTYFDIIFYLLAALLILRKKYLLIIPVCAIASLNRETSALIPLMMIVPSIDWKRRTFDKRVLLISILSVLTFAIVFVGVRMYYGFAPAVGINGMKSVTDYFIFNIKFFRLYPELIGTLTIIPLVVLLSFKRLPVLLKQWFWVICPVWFLIHLGYSTAVETRLFLVPYAIIFVPAFLTLIESWYRRGEELSIERIR